MTEQDQKDFRELAEPLIKFLNDRGHPHMHIVITTDSAEVSEGLAAFHTEAYILD